ncbi:hypothetical protein EMIT07CA2_550055 [Brevibacillus sp. IT-7CA2]|uniref:hypothetical protein n=1 Tax=Brevibacillus sp. IT-7CA2 TaxID=3026436 RepID=UPI0039DF920F
MKLRPYQFMVTNPKQVNEWRGRYKGAKVTIFKKLDQKRKAFYIFTIEHQRGIYDSNAEDGKSSETLEEARTDAMKWIDLYSFLNSPLMALSHYK